MVLRTEIILEEMTVSFHGVSEDLNESVKEVTTKTISDATLLYSAACVCLGFTKRNKQLPQRMTTKGEVGGTCREGFLPPRNRGDLEDGDNVGVGDNCGDKSTNNENSH